MGRDEEPPFIVPAWVVELIAKISKAALVVLVYLTHRAGKKMTAWPHAKTIAEDCGINRKTVFAAITELRNVGAVTVEKRPGYHHNEYHLSVPVIGTTIVPVIGTTQRPSKRDDRHPSKRDDKKGYKERVQQQQLQHSFPTEPEIDVNGIAAFPPPVGGSAALPDGVWLSPQLSLLDLRRVQLGVPDLTDLELFQIADIYHAFQLRKRRFSGDIKKQRKQRPDLQAWQWFAEEVQNFEDWKRIIATKQAGNVMHRSYHVDDANKRQPTIPQPHPDWQCIVAEVATGTQIDRDAVFYVADHPTVPASWGALSPWMRAIICGSYNPGRLTAKRKAKP